MSRTLILEDEEYRRLWFRKYMDYPEIVGTVSECISLLSQQDYDELWLDHDLGTEPEVGRDVAKWLIANPDVQPRLNIFVHSINATSGPKMTRELQVGGRIVTYIPFHELIARSAAHT